MSCSCTILPWDSAHWGFVVAKIDGHRLNTESAKRSIAWCEQNNVRCLYFAADGSCKETLRCASENGFRFVDVRVDMERGSSLSGPHCSGDAVCRAATQSDLAAMEHLARSSHQDTRFFKDANFDRAKASELYALWIAKDLSQHSVFAAALSGRTEKMLGYLTASESDAGTSRFGLLAVSPEARGRGLGRQLVQYALTWSQSCGMAKVRVATQGTNVPALRLYESCGFKVIDVKVWFHRWFTA